MSEKKQNPLVPTVISILGAIAWLIFILLHTLLWSTDFTFFQNIMITTVSLLVVALLIGLAWMLWVFKTGESSIC